MSNFAKVAPLFGDAWPGIERDALTDAKLYMALNIISELQERAAKVGLTPAENYCWNLFGQAMQAFRALESQHPSDLGDVVFHVHAIQNVLLARIGQRAEPTATPVIGHP